MPGQLAQLFFTLEELKVLHDLCDETLQVIGWDHADSAELNSLRTMFAEAQYGLERTGA